MGSDTLLVQMVIRGNVTMRSKPSLLAVLVVAALWASPVSAQVDLTGTWQRVAQNDNGSSREPVDLLGMPLG